MARTVVVRFPKAPRRHLRRYHPWVPLFQFCYCFVPSFVHSFLLPNLLEKRRKQSQEELRKINKIVTKISVNCFTGLLAELEPEPDLYFDLFGLFPSSSRVNHCWSHTRVVVCQAHHQHVLRPLTHPHSSSFRVLPSWVLDFVTVPSLYVSITQPHNPHFLLAHASTTHCAQQHSIPRTSRTTCTLHERSSHPPHHTTPPCLSHHHRCSNILSSIGMGEWCSERMLSKHVCKTKRRIGEETNNDKIGW